MITFQAAMAAMDDPAIADLNTAALDHDDVVNLIMQRSEIIRDQERYNKYIRAWIKGNRNAILDLIDQMGTDLLIRRAAAFIFLEYRQLRSVFDAKPPRDIADIGCGYGMFDLFLARDYQCQLNLIDLETNEHRHFGFEEEGAAYSSLASAKKLLTDNGVPSDTINTMNPETSDVLMLRNLDYAFSFISCGYHYPWHTYRDFFLNAVRKDGRIIIDIRAKTLGTSVLEISEIGYLRALEKAANSTADRVIIAKTDGI
ncbi:class I SAM-dependent methyltransferase [Sulfitobacter sp. SBS6]|uniref:class I SAM-dependent methyltransferase n=1 Tax=Sulfitobacter sp. SBS6 TaxID=3401755 RepID=UPI003AAA6FF9